MAAFNGESNANARYVAFAVKADEEGYKGVGSLFRAAARAEEIHAEDLPTLVAHFLRQLAEDLKVPQRPISAEALARLSTYKFPGNVPELRNILERAYILGRHAELSIEDFPESLSRISAVATTIDSLLMHLRLPGEPIDLRSILENVERELIIGALASSGGAQAEAARRLGISRSDLAYKVNKYNLRPHIS